MHSGSHNFKWTKEPEHPAFPSASVRLLQSIALQSLNLGMVLYMWFILQSLIDGLNLCSWLMWGLVTIAPAIYALLWWFKSGAMWYPFHPLHKGVATCKTLFSPTPQRCCYSNTLFTHSTKVLLHAWHSFHPLHEGVATCTTLFSPTPEGKIIRIVHAKGQTEISKAEHWVRLCTHS